MGMTNKEAIEILKELWRYEVTDYTTEENREALDLAIEKLEREWGAEEIEPCEDCISRKRLLARIDEERKHLLDIKMDGAEHIIVHHARRIIEDMPSVTPSIPDVEDDFNLGYNCGYTDAMIDISEGE